MMSSPARLARALQSFADVIGQLLHDFNVEFDEPTRQGLGRALLQAAMSTARARGADYMDLGTSDTDVAARALYESLGFSNREGKPDGPVNYYYEREL